MSMSDRPLPDRTRREGAAVWTLRRPAGRGLAASVALILCMGAALPLPGQTVLRREAAVQPIAAVEKGEYLLGFGLGHVRDVQFTLLDLQGDLTRFLIRIWRTRRPMAC